jgi:predicted nucleic acid-binding protein
MGLAGHAAFETFSVLTRLPPPQRLTASAAERLIATNFPHTRQLSAGRAASLIADLARLGITGGSVYDALVGAVAVEHGLRLISLDRRAERVYLALGVDLELL